MEAHRYRNADAHCATTAVLTATHAVGRNITQWRAGGVRRHRSGVAQVCAPLPNHAKGRRHTESEQDKRRTDATRKTTGQWHSTKGTLKETVGNLTGARCWAQSGQQEHTAGETEYNAAQAKGYAEGTKDRVGGRKDAVVGSITGDRQQEATGNVRRDKGETQQNWNRPQ